jgi:hypothetical protein
MDIGVVYLYTWILKRSGKIIFSYKKGIQEFYWVEINDKAFVTWLYV